LPLAQPTVHLPEPSASNAVAIEADAAPPPRANDMPPSGVPAGDPQPPAREETAVAAAPPAAAQASPVARQHYVSSSAAMDPVAVSTLHWPPAGAASVLPVAAPDAEPLPNRASATAPSAALVADANFGEQPQLPETDAGEYVNPSEWPGEFEPLIDSLLAPDWPLLLATPDASPMLPVVEPEIGDPRLDAPWAAARRWIAAVRTAPVPTAPRRPSPLQPGLTTRPVAPPLPKPAAAEAATPAQERPAEESDAPPQETPGVTVTLDAAATLASDDPLVATRKLARELRRARRAPRSIGHEASGLYKESTEHLRERRVDEAISVLERLVALHPGSAKGQRDLGAAYLRIDRLDDAHNCLIKALEIRPRFGDAYASLGDVYHLQGKVEEAIACYRRALSLKPGAAKIHSNLLLTLNYHRKLDSKTIFAEHLRWAEQHARPLETTLRPHDNPINPDRQLRLGYVSPDFRRHSVNFFAEPILARHDKNAFHITCYSDVARPDGETERIAALCGQWRDIREMSDEQVAAMVREDKIDILIDLAGHTGGNRLGVFARKPAPVQISYLGYPNTTGMRVMDFRITDAAADPPGQTEQFHSEQLVRLPNFLCYHPPADAPEPAPPPIAKNGFVTFGCFNILAKVTPEAISLWAKIMTVLPNSRLVMKDRIGSFASPARRRHVQDIFAYHRIAPDRVELLDKDPEFAGHLRSYERVDIMLDPYPYNGTTTTCESLWMGVPVVTLAGNRHAARVGVSVLTAAGLPEFIAPSLEMYARTAVVLARDPARLAVLRQTLRAKLRSSALLDGRRLTLSLEQRFRLMWQRWCKLRTEALQPASETMSLSDE
jgi:predicted O-linked N-acetylglucosamine transferase (SPINDLY family)